MLTLARLDPYSF